MQKGKKILLALLVLGVIGTLVYFFFIQEKDSGIIDYEISSSGTSLSGTTSVLPVIDSGSIMVGKKNIQVVAYISDLQWTVEKINTLWEKITVQIGEVITKDDTISTLSWASASLVFIDNSIVRLSENSRIQITRKAWKSIELSLLDGDIWARVLKPLYDTSFFTIKTADVSAGVRGTSIRIKKTTDKIKITVIDSYATDPLLAGADIEYGTGKQFLPKEHSIEIDLTKKEQKEKRENKKDLLRDEFVRDNTQKDLVYMNMLDGLAENPELKKRLAWEFKVTMPAKDEVEIFFDEGKIKSVISDTLKNEVWGMTDTKMLEMIKKDLTIRTIRQEMHPYISGGGWSPITPQQKRELDKKIEDVMNGKLDTLPNERPLSDRLMLDGKLLDWRREWRDLLDLGAKPGENSGSGTTQSGTTQTGEILPNPTKDDAPDCTPELIKQQVQCRMVEKPILPLDTDKDGIPDGKDNCKWVPNPGQMDSNGNGIGDACEAKPILPSDIDKDGIPDAKDNCPRILNPDQKNSYGDLRGDACEAKEILPLDTDKDGIPDGKDNCKWVPNPGQMDSNGNGIGDACEAKPITVSCGGRLCAEGEICKKITISDAVYSAEILVTPAVIQEICSK